MLEQFTPSQAQAHAALAKKPSAAASPPPASTGAAAAAKPTPSLDDLDMSEDFARELAEGMASLMREIAQESGDGKDADGKEMSEEEKKQDEVFKKAWEAMLAENLNGQDKGTGKGKAKEGQPSAGEAEGEEGFQDSIKRAMERMKESEAGLHVCFCHLVDRENH